MKVLETASLLITETIISTPTKALEIHLNLLSIDLYAVPNTILGSDLTTQAQFSVSITFSQQKYQRGKCRDLQSSSPTAQNLSAGWVAHHTMAARANMELATVL